MTYSASRTDVKNILQWLRGQDNSQWEDQVGSLAGTIYDLKEIAEPTTRRDQTGSRSLEPDVIPPEAVRIYAALPYLAAMLDAMRIRNRMTAIDNGQAALALLTEG